jgi:hypothetical protein
LDTSRLRQKVRRLDEERRMLLEHVLRPGSMIRGSLYEMRRRCGNPRCRCARGQLHASWYLSRREKGHTRLSYIGRAVPEWLATRVGRYGRLQKRLARIRKIDAQISACLNKLRDEKLESFEGAHQERR